MGLQPSVPDLTDGQKLKTFIRRVIELLLEENPHLAKKLSDKDKEELVKHIIKSINNSISESLDKNEKSDRGAILEKLKDPAYVKQMVILFVVANTASDPKIKADLTEKLKTILDPKLTPAAKLAAAKEAIKPFCAATVKQLSEAGMKFQPKPGSKKVGKEAEKEAEEEATKSLINLFGSDPRFAASIVNELALSNYKGNLIGAVDQNGMSPTSERPIDQENQISGKADFLGIIQEAVDNFIASGGCDFESKVVENTETYFRNHPQLIVH